MTDTTTNTEENQATTTTENPSQVESTQEASLLSGVSSDDTSTEGSKDESQVEGATTTTTEGEASTDGAAAETKEGEAGKPGDDEKPVGAPESYESFATPEGVAPMGKATDEAFRSVMKESNLTQDQAQTVLAKLGPAVRQDQQQRIDSQIQAWVSECKVDPEIGGDRLRPSAAKAEMAFNSAASPELQKLVRESGIGNHPGFIKSWKWVADRMSDDNFVKGNKPNTAPKLQGNVMRNPKVTAEILYGKK